jgi:hypothetical protein
MTAGSLVLRYHVCSGEGVRGVSATAREALSGSHLREVGKIADACEQLDGVLTANRRRQSASRQSV